MQTRTPEQIKSDITQLEHQRWHAVFANDNQAVKRLDKKLSVKRHQYVQATLKGGK